MPLDEELFRQFADRTDEYLKLFGVPRAMLGLAEEESVDESTEQSREDRLERALRDLRVVMMRAAHNPPPAPAGAFLACLCHVVTEALGDGEESSGCDEGPIFARFTESMHRLMSRQQTSSEAREIIRGIAGSPGAS